MAELSLSILSWNLYLGADVSRVIGVDSMLLPGRVAAVWETVNRTDFRSRAKKIAGAICRERPDVIALQEVCRWSSLHRRPLNERAIPETVEYDFLETLLGELNARGEIYFTAARSRGIDVLLPAANGPDIRLEDSLVLLLRAGRGHKGLRWAKPQTGRFAANLRTTLDGEPFEIKRGWTSVDLVAGEQQVRIINTHLEYFSSAVQPAQLSEILNGPGNIPGAVILTGDFNAHPGSATWQMLKSSGYVDAWETAGGGPGHTSGRTEDLRNQQSALKERIDWIMCRGGMEVLQTSLIGSELSDRTPEGMWPSDHAGLCARVLLRADVLQSGLGEQSSMRQPGELIEVV